MEVSSKLEHARKKHQECIKLLKGLWKKAEKSKRDHSVSLAEDLISSFSETPDAVSHTTTCYEELLVNFPGSVALHREYANFCEVVLGDFEASTKHLSVAEVLESGEPVYITDESKSVSKSNLSSAASHRSAQRRYVNSWLKLANLQFETLINVLKLHSVLLSQSKALHSLKRRILGFGVLLLVFSISGFVLFDVYLLSNFSVTRMQFLDRTLSYLQPEINAAITLRNMQIPSMTEKPSNTTSTGIELARAILANLSKTMRDAHSLNYMSPPSQSITDYFSSGSWSQKTVIGGQKGYEVVQKNFWDLMGDFISSVFISSGIEISDIQDPDYSAEHMTLEKRAVVSVFENFWTVSESLTDFYGLALDEIGSLQIICDIVVYTLLSVSLVFLTYISLAIVQNVKLVFPTCQHSLVGGTLVHSLPIGVVHKIFKFYLNSEKSLAIQGDEAAEKEDLEHTQDFGDGGEDVYTEEQSTTSKTLEKGVAPKVIPPNDSKVTLQSSSKILGRREFNHEKANAGYESEGLTSRFSRRAEQPRRYQHATLRAKTGKFKVNPEDILPLTRKNIEYHEQSGVYDSHDIYGDSATSRSSFVSYDSLAFNDQMLRRNLEGVISPSGESTSQVFNTSEKSDLSDEQGNGSCKETSDTLDEVSGSHNNQSWNMISLPRTQKGLSPATESVDAKASTMFSADAHRTASPDNEVLSLSQVRDGKDADRQRKILNPSWTIWRFPSIFQSSCVFQQAPVTKDASQDMEEQNGFNRLMLHKSNSNLPWYFQSMVHQGALAIVFILCCCVWLVPVRNFPVMINTANLIRGTRRTAGVVLLSIFVSRELILADGFSRLNTSSLYDKTLRLRHDLLVDINAFRLGGYIAVEKNTIRFGADQMGSSVMRQYKSVMYEAASEGLYTYLLQVHKALGIILAKYHPNISDSSYTELRFDRIITRLDRLNILSQDQDFQFLFQGNGNDAVDGILAVFYGLLYRTAIAGTCREIEKTKAFVNMLPVQVLSRQEVEYVMLFFLPEGLDDEGDALQPSGDGLELNEYGWQNAASDGTGVQDTAKTRAVTGQSLQDPRVC